jgi:hypothetical protein
MALLLSPIWVIAWYISSFSIPVLRWTHVIEHKKGPTVSHDYVFYIPLEWAAELCSNYANFVNITTSEIQPWGNAWARWEAHGRLDKRDNKTKFVSRPAPPVDQAPPKHAYWEEGYPGVGGIVRYIFILLPANISWVVREKVTRMEYVTNKDGKRSFVLEWRQLQPIPVKMAITFTEMPEDQAPNGQTRPWCKVCACMVALTNETISLMSHMPYPFPMMPRRVSW